MRFVLGFLLVVRTFGSVQATVVTDLPAQSSGYTGPWPALVAGKWGYIDAKGKLILPATYEDAWLFREGKAAVQQPGGWAFIHKNGKRVTKESYIRVRSFSEGYAAVETTEGWGFIDGKGALVTSNRYQGAGDFSQGLAPVRTESGWGFIDSTGKLVIMPEYEEVGLFREGLARVRKSPRAWSYIDTKGRKVLPGPYQTAADFSERLACTEAGGGVKFIDVKGELRFQIGENYNAGCLEDRSVMINGLALVLRVDYLLSTTMFVDTQGTIVIKPEHGTTYRQGFSDGLAVFSSLAGKKTVRYGYVDSKGRIKISPQYESAGSFNDGMALVTFQGRPSYIKTDGSKVWTGEK